MGFQTSYEHYLQLKKKEVVGEVILCFKLSSFVIWLLKSEYFLLLEIHVYYKRVFCIDLSDVG